ncbi:MAG TPA: oligosaccharide flippase family protein [Solirubrobacteraceae bacterium]|nr:oligosaccharide flippase family protein [Solirubrobacteraceae bacterium]
MSGVRWLVLTRAVSESVAVIATVALARMLAPAEFGRAAVALIFVPLAGILTFEGFASALVQRESVEDTHRSSASLTSLVGGLALSLLLFGLSRVLLGRIFGAETGRLVELMSPIFLLAAIGAVARATLWRALRFRALSLIDMVGLVSGNVVAIVLAALGLGGSAIVIGALVQVGSSSLLLVIAAPPPLPRWHRGSQRQISNFGVPAALAGLVDVLFRNVDYAIIAATLPAAQTGIYWRAFNLGVVYQDKLSGVMMQLAFPVYSRIESREELRRLHERAARVHAAVIFPLLALLIVLAPVAIPYILGSAWAPSVHPAQILAVAGMIAAVLTGYAQVMLAVGQPRSLLRFNLGMLAGYAAAVAVAASHGLIVVSIVVSVAYLGILAGVYRFLLQRYVGISIARLIPELGPAIVGCLALAAVSVPLLHLVDPTLGELPSLLIVAPAGLVAYALALRAVSRPAWSDLSLLFARVLPPLTRLRRLRGAVRVRPGLTAQPGAEVD